MIERTQLLSDNTRFRVKGVMELYIDKLNEVYVHNTGSLKSSRSRWPNNYTVTSVSCDNLSIYTSFKTLSFTGPVTPGFLKDTTVQSSNFQGEPGVLRVPVITLASSPFILKTTKSRKLPSTSKNQFSSNELGIKKPQMNEE